MSVSDLIALLSILSLIQDSINPNQIIWGGSIGIAGAIFGSILNYFFSKKTQEREWKKQQSKITAEEVYGPLGNQVKWIVWYLENYVLPKELNFEAWGVMQEDHRFYMVDEDFRCRLDKFFDMVRLYNLTSKVFRKETLPEIVRYQTGEIFGTEAQIELSVCYGRRGIFGLGIEEKPSDYDEDTLQEHVYIKHETLLEWLISQEHPEQYISRNYGVFLPDTSEVVLAKERRSYTESLFQEFWDSCTKKMKENEIYRNLRKATQTILEEARNLKEELAKRIREPWK